MGFFLFLIIISAQSLNFLNAFWNIKSLLIFLRSSIFLFWGTYLKLIFDHNNFIFIRNFCDFREIISFLIAEEIINFNISPKLICCVSYLGCIQVFHRKFIIEENSIFFWGLDFIIFIIILWHLVFRVHIYNAIFYISPRTLQRFETVIYYYFYLGE